MATRQTPKIDLRAQFVRYAGQFKGLNTRDPSTWPLLPRVSACAGLIAAVVLALWFGFIQGYADQLETEAAQEQRLRTDYSAKLSKAINLEALRRQREQVQQYVTQLEKQLPGRSEMDALLSDINQSGLGRSLTFELFRPGQVSVKEYYAELPITIRVTGRYHDIGDFAADIAHLSRIVTLNNLSIVPAAGGVAATGGVLAMDVTAKTFRYLDPDEVKVQSKATGARK
jgi:type IV pilus assembly protein PilO